MSGNFWENGFCARDFSRKKRRVNAMFDMAGLLGRKDPLTKAEWLEIIEYRRASIRPYLSTFTFLKRLGEVPMLRDNGNPNHGFKEDNPEIEPATICGGLTAGLKGIFCAQPRNKAAYIPESGFSSEVGGFSYPDGAIMVWGLSQSDQWILAQVTFAGEQDQNHKNNGYERAKKVRVSVADLNAMIFSAGIEPQDVLKELDEIVRLWGLSCKVTYERAVEMVSEVKMMENLLFNRSVPISSAGLSKVKNQT